MLVLRLGLAFRVQYYGPRLGLGLAFSVGGLRSRLTVTFRVRAVVLKVFFTFLPYKPKHCQFLPNKDHK